MQLAMQAWHDYSCTFYILTTIILMLFIPGKSSYTLLLQCQMITVPGIVCIPRHTFATSSHNLSGASGFWRIDWRMNWDFNGDILTLSGNHFLVWHTSASSNWLPFWKTWLLASRSDSFQPSESVSTLILWIFHSSCIFPTRVNYLVTFLGSRLRSSLMILSQDVV